MPVIHTQQTGCLKAYGLYPDTDSGTGTFREELTRDIGAAFEYEGTPGQANQGLRPAKFGLRGATRPMFVRMRPRPRSRPRVDWDGNAWNGNAWNANAWNANAWNRASWVASNWNGNAWTGNAWTANSWNVAAFE